MITHFCTHDLLNGEAQKHTLPSQSPDLHGKRILITGASRGIGAQIAYDFAKLGATILLLGKDQSALEKIYDKIEPITETAILPLDLSVAGFEQMRALAQIIGDEFGALDGILHNAGILGELTPLHMYNPSVFDDVITVNAKAPIMLTQTLFDILSDDACVLFTTSSVAKVRAFWGAYALSKSLCEGACSLFHQENARTTNLRFNCINPKATRTNMRTHAYPGEDALSIKPPSALSPLYAHIFANASFRGQIITADDSC